MDEDKVYNLNQIGYGQSQPWKTVYRCVICNAMSQTFFEQLTLDVLVCPKPISPISTMRMGILGRKIKAAILCEGELRVDHDAIIDATTKSKGR